MTKDKIISGLKMTMELFLFDPSTGETCEPDDLNELSRTTYDACKGAVELLENPEPHWIPVTERTPRKRDHKDDMVLVCNENGSIRFNTCINGTWVYGDPIAWMPLPEPYKEVKQNAELD